MLFFDINGYTNITESGWKIIQFHFLLDEKRKLQILKADGKKVQTLV
jgi:hypothetical protein